MSDRRERRIVVAITAVALCVVVAAFAPALVGGRPANQIPVEEASPNDDLGEPTAQAWSDVPTATMSLASAPSGLPDATSTTVSRAEVQVARTDARLYVRVTWPDQTADRNVSGPRDFADAVAVQVPVNTTTQPAIAMGSPRNHVNVWYWSADTGTQELLAGGPGSTTQFENASVETHAVHSNGSWSVVFSRPLETNASNRTQFTMERDVDVAFAVWNGSNAERSGRKSVSEWHFLALGPGPQGPPYEAFLWAVAGLAMLLVVVVTVLAVRRHGGA